VQCCFCGREVESVEEAVELGWYPDFWHGETNYQGPVCPECQLEHLVTDEDGEYSLKPDHALPPAAVKAGFVEIEKEKDMSKLIVQPKFTLGQVVGTPAALQAIEEAGQSPGFFLDRHVQGDWGEVCDEDKLLNDQALVDGSRLLSAYRTLKNTRIWIITEAVGDNGKRESTTILLPEQY
jgi:hypothetical protein